LPEKDEDAENSVKKAGTNTRGIADGRPGLSIALEGVAELQARNVEQLETLNYYSARLVTYSNRLETLTVLLLYSTVILFLFSWASLFFGLFKEYGVDFVIKVSTLLIILALLPTTGALIMIYKINPFRYLYKRLRR
jgi:hypothetical protein